jgi:integrase
MRWRTIGRRYRGGGSYATVALGLADDLTDADGIRVFDFWQAQSAARRWAEKQRLVDEGIVRDGPYTVVDAVQDYLEAVRAEKGPTAERRSKYIFEASILPELGAVLVEKLTADRLTRWRNSLATRPKRVRTKSTADRPATRENVDDDDARRKRKATANRILTMLKAALNRTSQAGRVVSDQAWRRVKPFAKVDEAVVRYLTVDEARRLVNACNEDFGRLVQAALLTGCRYSELTRLTASAFNPDSRTVAIRLSKGKLRHVTLTEEGALCFTKWTRGRDPSEHLFMRHDGGVWGPSHQQRPLEQASSAAGLAPPVTFHVLRHTHASQLAMRGAPMAVIAKQLGRRYSDDGKALRALGTELRGRHNQSEFPGAGHHRTARARTTPRCNYFGCDTAPSREWKIIMVKAGRKLSPQERWIEKERAYWREQLASGSFSISDFDPDTFDWKKYGEHFDPLSDEEWAPVWAHVVAASTRVPSEARVRELVNDAVLFSGRFAEYSVLHSRRRDT